MEINFESREIELYRECCCQTKRIQESAESVVPDTDDDIGRIAAVQTSVRLKSKDLTGRGVLVSGEANASIVYITEGQDAVSFVRLSKPFTMEFEAAELGPEAELQIGLSIPASDVRVINPRKVSVDFEIVGELCCYCPETIPVEASAPAQDCRGLHIRRESTELVLPNAACEKTFALNEQFSFPSGKPSPSRLVSDKTELVIGDCQLIGSKIIVKGSAEIAVCYLSDEVNYPVRAEFSAPFSQIVDIGREHMDLCTVRPEITAGYFDLTETVGGEKALDVELHAVLQLICQSRQPVVYIADAYSNLMPGRVRRQQYSYDVASDSRKLKLSADERVHVMDDCADVLSVFLSPSRLMQEQAKLSAAVNLDIVYRTSDGLLSAVRRTVMLTGESETAGTRITGMRLCDTYLRPDGQFVDAHLSLELNVLTVSRVELDCLSAVELDEDAAFDFSSYPTLSLVRPEGESLWELAKQYHSSVEKISAANQADGENNGAMLLIPKCI